MTGGGGSTKPRNENVDHQEFVRVCAMFERFGRTMRMRVPGHASGAVTRVPRRGIGRGDSFNRPRDIDELARHLHMSRIDVEPTTLVLAAKGLSVAVAIIALVLAVITILLTGYRSAIPTVLAACIAPFVAREVMLGHPRSVARRLAFEVVRSSAEGINLMVMSLRHEPSLSRAIRFGSRRASAFSSELRRCEWGVLTGRHSSFEEALQELGSKWAMFGEEMRSSLNSMITSTCESTEDGKRRALERANLAMTVGAKRRVEEYVLSLSTPTMVVFGLGVLLPLMVGSFLPMLSWNLWSLDGSDGADLAVGGARTTLATVFVMNVLFPAVALLTVLGAVSRNPVGSGQALKMRVDLRSVIIVTVASVSGALISSVLLGGLSRSAGILLASVAPTCLWFATTSEHRPNDSQDKSEARKEDFLFKIGARMVEGQNFESAVGDAAGLSRGDTSDSFRQFALKAGLMGLDADPPVERPLDSDTGSNATDGLTVVRQAAGKDERAAGILAMDLAMYLKDLRDIESTLRIRLRPTISMMRMTAYLLGPVVLGISFAIYMSLAAMVGNGSLSLEPGTFFLVLGVFLAESNAVVTYFVWAIESDRSRSDLLRSLGRCILAASVVFCVTVAIAS